MPTIADFEGRHHRLSPKMYRITATPDQASEQSHYAAGALVRLIAGVDGSSEPGYHFSEDYRTVCRVFAPTAEFAGVRADSLEEVVSFRVRCPDSANGSDIVGCGHEFEATPDEEGLLDCPECGIWFSLEEGTAGQGGGTAQ